MEIHGLSYGNYIHTPEGIKAITGVVESKIGFIVHWKGKDDEDESYCRAVHCKPVELTPEILEACGFTPEEDLCNQYLHQQTLYDLVLLNIEDSGFHLKYKSIHVQYLHHLQNIFYNNTLTQLKVN